MRILLLPLVFYAGLTFAETHWPDIYSPLSDVSCQLRKIVRDPRSGTSDQPICSGIYLRPTVFVTATHCIDDDSHIGGDLTTDPQVQLYVTCSGGRISRALVSYLNPEFFSSRGKINSYGEINDQKLGNPVGLNLTTDGVPDIAVFITQPMRVETPFPSLPKDFAALEELVHLDDCLVLGYSSEKCDIDHPERCSRRASVHLEGERLWISNATDFGHGDSGSGVVCFNKVKQPYLIGDLYGVGSKVSVIASTLRSQDFLRPFLNNAPLGPPLKYSLASKRGFQAAIKINRMYGLWPECKINTEVCSQAFTAFIDLLEADPSLATYIHNHAWNEITITDDTKSVLVPEVLQTQPVAISAIGIFARPEATIADFKAYFAELRAHPPAWACTIHDEYKVFSKTDIAQLEAKGYHVQDKYDKRLSLKVWISGEQCTWGNWNCSRIYAIGDLYTRESSMKNAIAKMPICD